MRLFRGFAVGSAVLAFAIAVLGSWVRINDAGLTCPDWPLCHGALVPSLAGGVVLEWSHRLVAFIEGFVVLGAIVAGVRVRRRVAGVTPTLVALGIVFLLQVSLGGATVFLANSPASVVVHWGTGMALLAILTVLAALSIVAPDPASAARLRPALGDGPAPALACAAVAAFVTMCVGAYVSSSYAGLACATFPTCDGTMWGTTASQFAQMLHRVAAGSFAVVALFATAVAVQLGSRRVRVVALAGAGLVLLQIALGIGNVVLRMPIAMREAHAANAGATFIAFVIATVLATLEPMRAPQATRDAVPAARIASNA